MHKEHDGKFYLKIPFGDLTPLARLRCDIFVYLPRNDRMVKIRDLNELVPTETLSLYSQGGHADFYVYDPTHHPGAYDISGLHLDPLNPKLPPEILAKILPNDSHPGLAADGGNAQAVDSESPGMTVDGSDHAPASSPILEPEKELVESNEIESLGRVVIKSNLENDSTIDRFEPEDSEQEIENISAEAGDEEEDRKISSKKSEDKSSRKIKSTSQEDEEGQRFTGDSEKEDKEEKRFVADKVEKEKEQRFKSNPSEKEEKRHLSFKAEKPEEDVERSFENDPEVQKAKSFLSDPKLKESASKQINSQLDELEEALTKFSPDQREFVNELRVISGAKEDTSALPVLTIPPDSPHLKGLEPEEVAATKLSFTLGKRTGLLRRELNQAICTEPKDESERELAQERKKQLREKIEKMEKVSMLLEALDQQDVSDMDLPGSLKGKPKQELLDELEKEMEEMRGSEVLTEPDAILMDKKIAGIRNKELAVHATGLDRVNKKLSEQAKRAGKAQANLDPEGLKALNRELAKEMRAAKIGKKISEDIIEKRRELREILEGPLQSNDGTKKQQRAMELQEKLQELVSLSFSVEAGENVSPALIEPFSVEVPDEIITHADGPVEVERVMAEIELLKESVIAVKNSATEEEKKLMEKINGEVESEKSLSSFESETRGDGLEAAKSRVEVMMNLLEKSGKKASPAEISDLNKFVSEKVMQAQVMRSIDCALAEKREKFQKLLKQRVLRPEEKDEQNRRLLEAQRDLQEVEKLKEAVAWGEAVESSRLVGLIGNLPSEISDEFVIKAGDPERPALSKMMMGLKSLSSQSEGSSREGQKAALEIYEKIIESGNLDLMRQSVRTRNVEIAKRQISRSLEEFRRTGIAPDPNAIWKVNKILSEKVKLAQAEVALAEKAIELTEEISAIFENGYSNDLEKEESKKKTDRLKAELVRVIRLGDAIDREEPIDLRKLEGFIEEVSDSFVIKAGDPPEEAMTVVMGALDSLRSECFKVKGERLEASANLYAKERLLAEDAADAALARMVPGDDGRKLQAGVYAATLFRAFGYQNQELEQDVILACSLWKKPSNELKGKVPDRVLAFHLASHGEFASGEMVLRDAAQAVRMAQGYLESPGVITGRFGIDSSIFSDYCSRLAEKLDKDFDEELLERARQVASLGMDSVERENLVFLAKVASEKLNAALASGPK